MKVSRDHRSRGWIQRLTDTWARSENLLSTESRSPSRNFLWGSPVFVALRGGRTQLVACGPSTPYSGTCTGHCRPHRPCFPCGGFQSYETFSATEDSSIRKYGNHCAMRRCVVSIRRAHADRCLALLFDVAHAKSPPPLPLRADGPIERYRVASKEVCRLTSVLGWAAVVIGAGEIVLGVVVFSKWVRKGEGMREGERNTVVHANSWLRSHALLADMVFPPDSLVRHLGCDARLTTALSSRICHGSRYLPRMQYGPANKKTHH